MQRLLFEAIMTVASILGAILLALNLPDWSKYGYVLFIIGSISGVIVGKITKVHSLTIMSLFFTIVNMLGVYRWVL